MKPTSQLTTGFSFGSNGSGDTKPSTGFSFATESNSSSQAKNDEDEEYVPPKPEGSEIVEEDAFFTQRCKLFYKKGDIFIDRGVGMLYLKKCEGKTQLLMRTDTKLGKILLNIFLVSALPTQRTGINNVTLCCVPNPPIDPKATPSDDPSTPESVTMLIRVKTKEDADKLFNVIQENKS